MDMDAEEAMTAGRAREAVERLLRTQVDLSAETRAVAQQLAQVLGQGRLVNPISLVSSDTTISVAGVPDGQQKRFIEAAQKNIELQKELARLRAEHEAAAATAAAIPAPSADKAEAERAQLRDHLECIRLARVRKRLEALERFHQHMDNQPAAAPDFLDPKVMFKDCAPLPELPKELVEGFTRDEGAPDQKIQELVSRFRKAALRQQLVLERDRRKLEALRAKHPINPRDIAPELQVKALTAVKSALVDWIETMLSKAGEGDDEAGDESGEGATNSPGKTDQPEPANFDVEARLADIQREYERHVELRKRLMSSMARLRKLAAAEPPEEKEVAQDPAELDVVSPAELNPEPQTYLLTPYLESLQSLSQEQKTLVQEKAYINATMARQQQEANKALQRLAQKSKLLAKYAPPPQSAEERSHANPSFSDATKAKKGASITEQIEPWLFAADSAKIATLESVAEEVDKGQIFIEKAMESLNQVSMLQNKGPLRVPPPPVEGGEDGSGRSESESAAQEEGQIKCGEKKGSLWATLDGNLGLINE
ncbi:hypothetical protein F5Y17DRAFT_295758 [Xylariaceae sp. FL0594]|nr:hypothetical protein F5Y17DRAFT_295758 [Xylariaceae sp. FL0594]